MIYRYKATLPKSKTFFRMYEVKTTTTLYGLHHFLQNDLSFAPDQQVFFKTFDAEGRPMHTYGLFDMGQGAMDQVRLATLLSRGETMVYYVFDTFNERAIILQYEGEDEELPSKVYPRTVQDQGVAPDQFNEDVSPLELNIEELDPAELGIVDD